MLRRVRWGNCEKGGWWQWLGEKPFRPLEHKGPCCSIPLYLAARSNWDRMHFDNAYWYIKWNLVYISHICELLRQTSISSRWPWEFHGLSISKLNISCNRYSNILWCRTHGNVFLRFWIVYCSQGNREQPAHYLKQYKNAGKRFRVHGAYVAVWNTPLQFPGLIETWEARNVQCLITFSRLLHSLILHLWTRNSKRER